MASKGGRKELYPGRGARWPNKATLYEKALGSQTGRGRPPDPARLALGWWVVAASGN